MKKLIALVFGASVATAAMFAGCGKELDTSLLAGTPGQENCTHIGCFWLGSPDHPMWAELDNGVNPPRGQDTVFYRSGLTYGEVLLRPPAGDAYLICAYQFIAVQLNRMNGANSIDVDDSYDTARILFTQYSPGDVAQDALLEARLRSLSEDLMAFNTGELGPGTCTCSAFESPRIGGSPGNDNVSTPGAVTWKDAGAPPPIDAAVPPPPIDAPTAPPGDGGVPPIDAGVPPIDAAPPQADAATPEVDAGPVLPDPCTCVDRPDQV